MGEFQKTDLSKSPLLKQVIERDYTKGGFDFGAAPEDKSVKPEQEPEVKKAEPVKATVEPEPQKKPVAQASSDDFTKPFSFDEETGSGSDVKEGEAPEVKLSATDARTFANTIGNLIQIYVPKATYGYVKIDIDNARVNVEKGYLSGADVELFQRVNNDAEEALKIPDEEMKMWKAAFQHWLEYKQLAFANPNTEFIVATGILLTSQIIRTVSLKKSLEDVVAQVLATRNPGLIVKKGTISQPEKVNNIQTKSPDGEAKAA